MKEKQAFQDLMKKAENIIKVTKKAQELRKVVKK